MRRRRKRRKLDGIELNLAAMLDMAFQLLMFFILTFNPAQIEAQFAAYIPAAKPITQPKLADKEETKSDIQLASHSEIIVTVEGSSAGKIEKLAVDGKIVSDLTKLNSSVHNAICRQGDDCEQLTVQVDANLCYEELMQVVDICTQQELPQGGSLAKLKLVELQAK